MPEKVSNFIESCLPYLRSHWNEIRANACTIIGLLHQHGNNLRGERSYIDLETASCEKIFACLKDDNVSVRMNAAEALGYLFTEQ